VKIHNTASSVRAANSVSIEVLEQSVEEARQRLIELVRTRTPVKVPEQTVARGKRRAWRALQASLEDDVSTFEGEY